MERRTLVERILPTLFQTAAILGAGWAVAQHQEHRFTVLEEAARSQQQAIQLLVATQDKLTDQMMDIQKTQSQLITLERYIHGGER